MLSAYLSCIQELVKLAEINRGRLLCVLRWPSTAAPPQALFYPLLLHLASWRRCATLNSDMREGGEEALLPRDGRRLRIGFCLLAS